MSTQSQNVCEINNFMEFLEKSLKQKIVEYTLKPLTVAGDNYGSIMQAVDVKVAKGDALHLVVKTSVTNPLLVEAFQPALSFVKETHFYSDIIPAIKQLEHIANVPNDERIDAFIRCLGSRISLNPDAKRADTDAILMLENIKFLNYNNIDRCVGFDNDEMQEILRQLAKMNSLCIAARRLEPELFNSKIKPFLEPVNFNNHSEGHNLIKHLCGGIRYIEGLDSKLLDKVEKHLSDAFDWSLTTHDVPDTPFSTVVHRDFWCNNVMIRKDNTANKPIEIKIYDFQVFFYESFVYDLIFCLCSCANSDILANNFKSLVNFYLDEFKKSLKLVNCPLEDYSRETMWNEIRTTAKMEISHILMMTLVRLADKSITDIESFSPESFMKKKKPSDSILNRWKLIIDLFVENEFI